MEKRGWLRWCLALPVALLAIAFTCCEDQFGPGFIPDDATPVIGPEGGIVNGFDGEVVMVIPAGALKDQVKFSMHEVLYKSATEDKEFLKTFVIEPSVIFSTPVTLIVRWDGCLSNGCTPCDGADIYFCTWCNLSAFCQNMEGCRFTCCVDMPNETISACIGGTGVIATIGKMR
jgi:hypothetical protein